MCQGQLHRCRRNIRVLSTEQEVLGKDVLRLRVELEAVVVEGVIYPKFDINEHDRKLHQRENFKENQHGLGVPLHFVN